MAVSPCSSDSPAQRPAGRPKDWPSLDPEAANTPHPMPRSSCKKGPTSLCCAHGCMRGVWRHRADDRVVVAMQPARERADNVKVPTPGEQNLLSSRRTIGTARVAAAGVLLERNLSMDTGTGKWSTRAVYWRYILWASPLGDANESGGY